MRPQRKAIIRYFSWMLIFTFLLINLSFVSSAGTNTLAKMTRIEVYATNIQIYFDKDIASSYEYITGDNGVSLSVGNGASPKVTGVQWAPDSISTNTKKIVLFTDGDFSSFSNRKINLPANFGHPTGTKIAGENGRIYNEYAGVFQEKSLVETTNVTFIGEHGVSGTTNGLVAIIAFGIDVGNTLSTGDIQYCNQVSATLGDTALNATYIQWNPGTGSNTAILFFPTSVFSATQNMTITFKPGFTLPNGVKLATVNRTEDLNYEGIDSTWQIKANTTDNKITSVAKVVPGNNANYNYVAWFEKPLFPEGAKIIGSNYIANDKLTINDKNIVMQWGELWNNSVFLFLDHLQVSGQPDTKVEVSEQAILKILNGAKTPTGQIISQGAYIKNAGLESWDTYNFTDNSNIPTSVSIVNRSFDNNSTVLLKVDFPAPVGNTTTQSRLYFNDSFIPQEKQQWGTSGPGTNSVYLFLNKALYEAANKREIIFEANFATPNNSTIGANEVIFTEFQTDNYIKNSIETSNLTYCGEIGAYNADFGGNTLQLLFDNQIGTVGTNPNILQDNRSKFLINGQPYAANLLSIVADKVMQIYVPNDTKTLCVKKGFLLPNGKTVAIDAEFIYYPLTKSWYHQSTVAEIELSGFDLYFAAEKADQNYITKATFSKDILPDGVNTMYITSDKILFNDVPISSVENANVQWGPDDGGRNTIFIFIPKAVYEAKEQKEFKLLKDFTTPFGTKLTNSVSNITFASNNGLPFIRRTDKSVNISNVNIRDIAVRLSEEDFYFDLLFTGSIKDTENTLYVNLTSSNQSYFLFDGKKLSAGVIAYRDLGNPKLARVFIKFSDVFGGKGVIPVIFPDGYLLPNGSSLEKETTVFLDESIRNQIINTIEGKKTSETVIKGIETLPQLSLIDISNKQAIEAQRISYNKLSGAARNFVTNSEKLYLAERKIAELEAEKLFRSLDIAFANGDTANSITQNLILPMNNYLSYSSSDIFVISNNGEVDRPSFDVGDKTVVLTANINYQFGEVIVSMAKNYTLTVKKLQKLESLSLREESADIKIKEEQKASDSESSNNVVIYILIGILGVIFILVLTFAIRKIRKPKNEA